MNNRVTLVHFSGEVGIKGQNRAEFENQLIRNIRKQLGVKTIRKEWRRLVIEHPEPLDLGRVFGVAWWAEASVTPPDMDAMTVEATRQVEARLGTFRTFRVRATRSDKSFPLTSLEMQRQIGKHIVERFDLEVALKGADLEVHVELTPGKAFIFSEKHRGLGGLPVGTAGKLVGLFSGGLDSAVAAYLMAKRGTEVHLIHFYALRNAETAHAQKVGQLAEALVRYLPRLHVHYVPYHHFQFATLELDRRFAKYDLVTFRRFMARTAERLAEQIGAQGLFSGDSLGQVASQTLTNLAAVDRVLSLPIFRPLIAYDKQEIINLGTQLGMFEISNQDYKDCCSIISRKPATRANLKIVEQVERAIQVDALIEQSLAEMTTFTLPPKEPVDEIRHKDTEDTELSL